VDRGREHLSASDAAIIRLRRHLLAAAEALEAQGTAPPGVNEPDLYRSHGEQMLVGPSEDWKEVYAALMAQHYPSLQAAPSAA
jgi:hypothetical protein